MNRPNKIVLEHRDLTPTQFAEKAHRLLREACRSGPSGGTPTYEKLKASLDNARGNTMHYLFTDGVPNSGPEQVAQLILNRARPKQNPISLVSCTDVDAECEWMKEIEEDAPYVSETDDYVAERKEVIHDQGPAFPYSKGLWLLCLLVGAINPYDLDALDDSKPLSKFTLDNIMGRTLTIEEYKVYWNAHPKHSEYSSYFNRLSTESTHTEQIIGKRSVGALSSISARFKAYGF